MDSHSTKIGRALILKTATVILVRKPIGQIVILVRKVTLYSYFSQEAIVIFVCKL